MSSPVLLQLLNHKAWATQQLFEMCKPLSADVLDATQPGFYGSIRATLRHLVNADTSYFHRMSGKDVPPPLPEDIDIATLAERFNALAPQWPTLFADQGLVDREIRGRDSRYPGVVSLAQSLHHAEVHRTHVLSMLGAHGMQVPDLDIWEFAETIGQVKPL